MANQVEAVAADLEAIRAHYLTDERRQIVYHVDRVSCRTLHPRSAAPDGDCGLPARGRLCRPGLEGGS